MRSMRHFALFVLLPLSLFAETSAVAPVSARLRTYADFFERHAHRFAGIETLRQTVPRGVRTARNARGIETGLPGFTREIVSEYGFVSMDVRGGSLREVRRVLAIDGQQWNKESKSLKALARDLAAQDDRTRKRSLEGFEAYGLHGFVSDLGQLILLFARDGADRCEFRQEPPDADGSQVWSYQQLDGDAAVTVYGETETPVRQKLQGQIWLRPDPERPLSISITSTREYDGVPIHDRSVVDYAPGAGGILLPLRILHQQHAGSLLLVTDEFTYSRYRQILPFPKR